MALTVANGMTVYATQDGNAADWDEGTTSDYTEGQREGTGYVGYDVDIETLYNFNTVAAPPADMTGYHIGVWLRISNAGDVDTKANGGIQIAIRDITNGYESYFYVGGSDTYSGGWAYFVVDVGRTPDANNGTNADITDVDDLGVGFKMLTKTLDDNCHIDLMHYGTSGLVVTGTPDTGTYGTDNATQELYDLVDAANHGLLDKQAGVFVGKGPIQFNDDATAACTFNDAGSTFVWADLPVSSSWYKFSLGSSSGITALRLGTVVGSGDDRQGVNGGSILTAGQAWNIDFATNLGGNASNAIKLYGLTITDAQEELSFDDNGKTSIVSASFVTSGEIDLGTTNGGAELLNSSIIDPTGPTNNYGLNFPQTPSAGVLTHNAKNLNFITSGAPTTQYMLDFPYTGDYSVDLVGFKFFGDYSSGTIWHGINSGTNADITINASGGSDPVQAEFSNTASGTVSVVNTINVTFDKMKDDTEVRVYNAGTNTEIAGVEDATAGSADNRNFAWSASAGTVVDYVIHHWSGDEPFYQTIRKDGYTVPSADTTIEINQLVNRNAT